MVFELQFDNELLTLMDCPRSLLENNIEELLSGFGYTELQSFDKWLLASKCVRHYEIAVIASECEIKYSSVFRATAKEIAKAIEERAAKAKAAK